VSAFAAPDPTTKVHDRFAIAAGAGRVDVAGAPSPEETAAILAAVEALWPRPVVLVGEQGTTRPNAWRFSGRWWARPVAARRDRPW
jgi:hypothetical protein